MRAAVAALLSLLLMAAGDPPVAQPPPVRAVGPARVVVQTPEGSGQIPLYASADWNAPLPDISRAVLVLHGLDRDADQYFAGALAAQRAAGPAGRTTLMLSPQILADEDIAANHLGAEMLHWGWDDWSGGARAHGPVPASSFAAIDAVLARLADRRRFPHLADVVVAGFSAGGQVVQRYAVVGNGEAALKSADVRVRYVVGSPSTYLYFSADRPFPDPGCVGVNRWKYGFGGGVPGYVTGDPATLEKRYAGRDVIYLLGTADTDPHHPALDRSCAGEAQGPFRYARGQAYLRYLRGRDGQVHREWDVPGVAHNGRRVFNSACGLAALFDKPGCKEG